MRVFVNCCLILQLLCHVVTTAFTALQFCTFHAAGLSPRSSTHYPGSALCSAGAVQCSSAAVQQCSDSLAD